jgi:SlyX protein
MSEEKNSLRIQDLEMRVAFQEDALDKLSDVIAQQDKTIVGLRRAIQLLNEQIRKMDTQPGATNTDEPPPPHY